MVFYWMVNSTFLTFHNLSEKRSRYIGSPVLLTSMCLQYFPKSIVIIKPVTYCDLLPYPALPLWVYLLVFKGSVVIKFGYHSLRCLYQFSYKIIHRVVPLSVQQ